MKQYPISPDLGYTYWQHFDMNLEWIAKQAEQFADSSGDFQVATVLVCLGLLLLIVFNLKWKPPDEH